MKANDKITSRLNQLAGVTKPTNKNTFKTTLKHKDMRQQVEVIVKMTFDVDAGIDQEQAKQEIAYWVSETMQTMDDMESKYGFMGSEIVSIKEEAEIYDVEQEQTTGNFKFQKQNTVETQKYAVVYFEGKHPYLTSGKPYKITYSGKEYYMILDDDKDYILISTDGYCVHLTGEGINANWEIKTLEEIYMDQRENVKERCPLCGRDEAVTTGKQTFAGTWDEPAEYKSECHKCGHEVNDTDWVDGYETFEEWQERTGYYEEQD